MPADTGQLELLDRQLHQAYRNAVNAELGARGLGEIGHPMLLTILETSEGAPPHGPCRAQRDLAELLHISPAAVSNSLKSLERGGYIRREPGPTDARRSRVLLTDKGRSAVEGCRAAFQAVSRRMLAGITEEEKARLTDLCGRMLANLQKSPEKEGN